MNIIYMHSIKKGQLLSGFHTSWHGNQSSVACCALWEYYLSWSSSLTKLLG